MERTGKELIVAIFKIIFQHLSGKTEKPLYPVSCMSFETDMSQMKVT
jgi:hypothetical protein